MAAEDEAPAVEPSALIAKKVPEMTYEPLKIESDTTPTPEIDALPKTASPKMDKFAGKDNTAKLSNIESQQAEQQKELNAFDAP